MADQAELDLELQDLEVLTEDLPEATSPSRWQVLRDRVLATLRAPRPYHLAAAFVLGVLVGWFVLGWLIFPVRWADTDPWDLRTEHQKRYIHLVAEEYWRTGDLPQARSAVDGWDTKSLAQVMAKLESETSKPEERQHVAALAEALSLSLAQKPLLASFLGQKAILFSLVLAAVPMLAAMALAFSSLTKRAVPEEMALEEEESLLEEEAQILQMQQAAAQAQSQAGQAQAGEEQKKPEAAGGADANAEADKDVANILTSLFDDDNEALGRLEKLGKGLGDITGDELLRLAKDVAKGLTKLTRAGQAAA
jgi:hypothetical protein